MVNRSNYQVSLNTEQLSYLSQLDSRYRDDIPGLIQYLLDTKIDELKSETIAKAIKGMRAALLAIEQWSELPDLNAKGPAITHYSENKTELKSAKMLGAPMTNSERILSAVKNISKGDFRFEFSRNDIRLAIGVSSHDWLNSYTAIFQAMRGDQPGGAPPISDTYRGVFKRVKRGTYVLTEKGRELITNI